MDAWHKTIILISVIVLLIIGTLVFAFGAQEGIAKHQQRCVKAGVGRWGSNADGKPTFEFIRTGEKK